MTSMYGKIGGNGGSKDKAIDKNANPNTDKPRERGRFGPCPKNLRLKDKLSKCKNCKREVLHFDDDCFSLAKNKSKCPDGWVK